MEHVITQLLRLVKEGKITEENPIVLDNDDISGRDPETDLRIFESDPWYLLREFLAYHNIPWDEA
jgi:hypothetical protein